MPWQQQQYTNNLLQRALVQLAAAVRLLLPQAKNSKAAATLDAPWACLGVRRATGNMSQLCQDTLQALPCSRFCTCSCAA
jgi:hypothetical protein